MNDSAWAKSTDETRRGEVMKRNITSIAALALALLPVLPAQAILHTWNTFPSGDYDVAGNWAPNGHPGAGDNVRFSAALSQTINFNANEAAADTIVQNSSTTTWDLNGFTFTTDGGQSYIFQNATLNVTGGGLWSMPNYILNIGSGNSRGDLTVESGVTVRPYVPTISYQATASTPSTLWIKSGGVVSMDGFGSSSSMPIGSASNHDATLTGAGLLSVANIAPSPFAYVNNHGIIAPGDAGTGTLTMQDIYLQQFSGSKLSIEIGGTGAGQFDKLAMTGSLGTLDDMAFLAGSILEVKILASYPNAQVGDYFDLVTGGDIAGLPLFSYHSGSFTNYESKIEIVTLDATHEALRFTIMPEPGTMALLALGGVLLAWRRCR
jgi:hypothetical protein